jgi:hypothetical protein
VRGLTPCVVDALVPKIVNTMAILVALEQIAPTVVSQFQSSKPAMSLSE